MNRLINTSDRNARAILLALCNDRTQQKKALNYLDQLEKKAAQGKAASQSKSAGNSLRRKAASVIKICVQCQEPFYEEENGPKAWELKVDHESLTWDDWDEICHGTIDSEKNRRESPEGFIWTCCGKIGTHEGCTRGPHEAINTTRGRYRGPEAGRGGNVIDISSDSDEGNSEDENEDEEDKDEE
ncbi:hypothetical protein F5B20DRAFT_580579 [Whalleya microplaca]|nr:hypothetical protein F5B20DRAFT_580579 [Whalleya microplaca]